ncbi:MAG TPA: acyl-ACP--UDP-N-acetylglucosamine O-acyltransferase [Gemmatimonadota bacterium]|jgi:UDP-N-acetylglucosamine acyltransferase
MRTRQATADIHSTAIVDPTAIVKDEVKIGPYAIVGPEVTIGEGSRVFAHAVIERGTTIGDRCQIHYGAVIGGEPQDLKYEGEETGCLIGDGTVIREYVTVSRGTRALGRTEVGEGCLLMAYVHVAHDCLIGDGVILSNAVNLAGHVTIDEQAIIGGMTPVHQFVRIGAHSFVGGGSRVQKDIPPFVKAAGIPTALFGLNTVGLDRRGFPENVKTELKRAYRLFFNSKLNIGQALERAEVELHPYPEIQRFLTFIRESERGITV